VSHHSHAYIKNQGENMQQSYVQQWHRESANVHSAPRVFDKKKAIIKGRSLYNAMDVCSHIAVELQYFQIGLLQEPANMHGDPHLMRHERRS